MNFYFWIVSVVLLLVEKKLRYVSSRMLPLVKLVLVELQSCLRN